MRRGGGKQKGAEFERTICKQLSLWVSKGENEGCFWRSAMSGGRSTVAHAKGKRLAAQAGDISSIHELGHEFVSDYLIELKFYRDLEFIGLLTNRGHLVKFWQEACRQAKLYDKSPLLIAKQNQQPVVAIIQKLTARTIGIDIADLTMLCPQLDMRIILFEDLLKTDPTQWKRHSKN